MRSLLALSMMRQLKERSSYRSSIRKGQKCILVRNWDRLGGRVHGIVNGYLVSRVLGLDFCFLWPDEWRFPEMRQQEEIFSETFLRQHRIELSDIEGYEVAHLPPAEGQRLEEYLQLLEEMPGADYFEYNDFSQIPKFLNVDTAALFVQIADEIFAEKVKLIEAEVRAFLVERGVSRALHLRYGDLLLGSFRQYPDLQKYTPYYRALQILSAQHCGTSTILISDTAEIAEHLCALNGRLLSSGQLTLHCCENGDFEGVLKDLLIMKNCGEVLGAARSIFSQLGAHLGGRDVQVFSEVAQNAKSDFADDMRHLCDDRLYQSLPPMIAGALLARDISYFLDFGSRIIELEEWLQLSGKAMRADEGYVVAGVQHALAAAFCGFKDAQVFRILDTARKGAHEVQFVHHDPLFYVAVADVFFCALRSAHALSSKDSSLARNFIDRAALNIALMKQLQPFQIAAEEILLNLECVFEVLVKRLEQLERIETSSSWAGNIARLVHVLSVPHHKAWTKEDVYGAYCRIGPSRNMLSALCESLRSVSTS